MARLARGSVVVVLGHGGPHALHLVPVLDVCEGEHVVQAGEGLALLLPEAEVAAPADALGEVHDLHVGPREHARVARRQPPVGAACVFGQALMEIFLRWKIFFIEAIFLRTTFVFLPYLFVMAHANVEWKSLNRQSRGEQETSNGDHDFM